MKSKPEYAIPFIGPIMALTDFLDEISNKSKPKPEPLPSFSEPPKPPVVVQTMVQSPDEPRKRTIIEIRKEIIENSDGSKKVFERELSRSEIIPEE
jgi:hypothetical protein